ncbi:hypothetical protein [Erwinia phage vB_Ea277G]|jgi:hypothetical protein|nr:hypothetical protein [Erwinia phage vB_Ea277G]
MSTAFECTVLKGVNNTGKIKRLDNGYVEVVLGALEHPNSYGAVYDEGRAREFLRQGSVFMRRISQGFLRGELGHPPQRECRDYNDYVERIHTILEKNVAIHIRKVWIDSNHVLNDGRKCIAIMGEICPDGPHAHVVERLLNNPSANLAFSIRSMATDKYVAGKKRKYLDAIITWDVVNEPGLDVATKYNSPSCESFQDIERVAANLPAIRAMAERRTSQGVAVESSIAQTLDAVKRLEKNQLSNAQPAVTRWLK